MQKRRLRPKEDDRSQHITTETSCVFSVPVLIFESRNFIMNIIIAGSRHFRSIPMVADAVDIAFLELLKLLPSVSSEVNTIFSGGAQGVDRIGEAFAYKMQFYLRIFPAYWAIHGKKAGALRNREMAAAADALILVWDGISKGSANMLIEAKKSGLIIVQRILNLEE